MSAAEALKRECPLKTDKLALFIIKIGEMISGKTLYRYQLELAIAIVRACLIKNDRKESEPTALFPRQSGKSETLAIVAIACSTVLPWLAKNFPDDERVSGYNVGFFVTCYAPKQDKAQLIYDRVREYAEGRGDGGNKDLVDFHYKNLGIHLVKSRGDSSAWSNGSIIRAISASEKVDNEGDVNHMVIIDEAQKMSAYKISKELRPTLASTNGPMISIGTANASKGYFYKKIENNINEGKKLKRKLHFQYDYLDVIKEKQRTYNAELKRYTAFRNATDEVKIKMLEADPDVSRPANKKHLNYAAYVNGELAELRGNVDDESFKMNFRLLWQDNRNIAISMTTFKGLAIPNMEMNYTTVMNPIGAGLDVAKGSTEDADQTVLTFMAIDLQNPILDKLQTGKADTPLYHYYKIIINLTTAQGSFEEEQYRKIVAAFMKYPTATCLYVDATGMGDPVHERLAKLLHWVRVVPYPYSTSSKSIMFEKYLPELKTHRIRYAAGPETIKSRSYEQFMSEHETLQKYHVGNYPTCAAEQGEHDDFPNSAALANLACNEIVSDPRLVKKMLTSAEQALKLNGKINPYKRTTDRYRTARVW